MVALFEEPRKYIQSNKKKSDQTQQQTPSNRFRRIIENLFKLSRYGFFSSLFFFIIIFVSNNHR